MSNNHLFRTILMNDLAKTKQLLTLGADPNVTDEDGLTPLIYGVNSNRSNALAIVEVLLEAGANINYKLPTVNPPLIQAADCHNMPMVKLLVAKQADVNLLDKDNLNIMDYGLIHKFQPLIDFCESINLAPNRPDLSKD
ncbi:MAG: ankyrin repeat domain-containing protein [Victivallaceae bacterium]